VRDLKHPSLRVTSWLGDIPVDVNACFVLLFASRLSPFLIARFDERYGAFFNVRFDQHFKHVHMHEDSSPCVRGPK